MTPGVSGDLVVRYGARFVAVTIENVSIERRRISVSHTRLRVHLTTHGKATRRVLWAARTICELPKQVWTIGGAWASISVPNMHHRAITMEVEKVPLGSSKVLSGGAHCERLRRPPRVFLGSKCPQHDPRG